MCPLLPAFLYDLYVVLQGPVALCETYRRLLDAYQKGHLVSVQLFAQVCAADGFVPGDAAAEHRVDVPQSGGGKLLRRRELRSCAQGRLQRQEPDEPLLRPGGIRVVIAQRLLRRLALPLRLALLPLLGGCGGQTQTGQKPETKNEPKKLKIVTTR